MKKRSIENPIPFNLIHIKDDSMMNKISIVLSLLLFLTSCDAGNNNSSKNTNDTANTTDITNKIFTNRATHCSEYVDQYSSSVKDVGENVPFDGDLIIRVAGNKCTFTSNAIPNHNFNDGATSFVNKVSENTSSYSITQAPAKATNSTSLSLTRDNAIFLNGVKLDLLAAACYDVGPDPLGQEKIGCNDPDQPFRYDPMSSLNNFGTDSHNAHTQPDGTYHYHGNPNAMFSSSTAIESPVIGFAADGYPIYGSYFNDQGTIRKAKSSYQLKTGTRLAVTYKTKTYSPGGTYDGKFIDDYEYVNGLGDLDECNGMTLNGNYGYYVTDTYPWVLKCYKGTPDSSFDK